ncbi:sushi, von Willebrand factor type A, EGF and pentraxin domain-containing protein 1-like [Bolinopsis microptera]|uniref:sushi, von Willebrand factor type A, EGF and pentraxin domain-containing protein 1-like n=1 Tax=Bolinopsis microptera TaxID=2820187 RepID=UPI003078C047
MSQTCPVSCGFCSPVSTCPQLNIPRGSVRPRGPVKPDSFVSVHCEKGYKYSEPWEFLQCLPDGRYDIRVGQCRKDYCDKPRIAQGRISSPGLIMSGHWVTVICDQGFKHSHAGSRLYCRPDSLSLEGTVGFCQPEALDCPEMDVAFGEVHPRGVVTSNSWAQIKCFEGFAYSEPTPFILCRSDGKYEGVIGNCFRSEPIRRCRIPKIDNAITSRSATSLPGKTIRIVCSAGYVYSLLSTTHSCTHRGRFNPPIGSCNPILQCSVPVILNAHVDTSKMVSAGAWVKVTCNSHFTYTLSETNHFCDRNGELVPKMGKCIRLFPGPSLSCPPIKIPGSLSLPATPIGMWVQMECHPGYQYSLNKCIHICLNSQTYTPPIGRCVAEESNASSLTERRPTHCSTPKIANSLIPASPALIDTWLKVECVPGYSYSRTNYLHYCQGDGTYNLEFGECIEDKPLGRCSKVGVQNGETRPDSEVLMGALVEVICDDGYLYSRPTAVHFCGIDLQFEPKLGECTRIQCPELDVDKAIIVPTAKPSAFEKVFVICLAGLEYVGDSPTFTCLSNGSYDGVTGTCENKDDLDKSLDQEFIEVGFLTKAVVQIISEENDSDGIDNYDKEISNDSNSNNQFQQSTVEPKENPYKRLSTNPSTTGEISKYTLTEDNRIQTEAPTSHLLYSTPDYGNDPSLVTPNKGSTEGESKSSPSQRTNGISHYISRNSTVIPNQVATSEPDDISNEISESEENSLPNSQVAEPKIMCPPIIIEHGVLDPPGEVPASTEVRVGCDEGYLYNRTDHVIRCGGDGRFAPDIGSCVPNGSYCKPPVILHGTPQPPDPIKSGLYFSMICDEGFKLSGNHYSLCHKGVVKSELGICKRVCRVSPIHGGVLKKYRLLEGENITLSCNLGYEQTGNGVSLCTETGRLDQPLGRCELGKCPLPAVANGSFRTILGLPATGRVTVGDTVFLKCWKGFALRGNSQSSCLSSFEFDPPIGRCVRECQLPIRRFGIYSSFSVTHGDNVSLNCDPGYDLVGANTSVCRRGVLVPDIGACAKSDCPAFPYSTPNGSLIRVISLCQCVIFEIFISFCIST